MLAEINQARGKAGLSRLRESPLLTKSSAGYSRYMLAHDFFGHQGSLRMSAKFSLRGEILAWHTGGNPRVRATLRNWLTSGGHRGVILHPRMRYVGVGLERGNLNGRFASMWTVHFGSL